jgi:TolB-like protein/Tfp pilus assembly protein PilF
MSHFVVRSPSTKFPQQNQLHAARIRRKLRFTIFPMADAATETSRREDRLESWKEIAGYLNRDVRTVQRWEKTEDLPVHRHLHDKLGSVYAYRSEIEAWWKGRGAVSNEPENGAPIVTDAGSDDPPVVEEAASEAQQAIEPDVPQPPSERRHPIRTIAIFAAAVVVVVALLLALRNCVRPQVTSVAVLPFANLSGDPAQEYFSDGMTEELITQLGWRAHEKLRVVALGSSMVYKNTQKRLKQVASELGVDYVLTGSVRRSSDRVRIAVHLVRARDESDVWDVSYDRNLGDVLALQTEVADAIAGGASIRLTARPAPPQAINAAAYEAYLKGRYFWNKRTPRDLQRALEFFQQVTNADPKYAPAYAGIADCYALLGSAEMGVLPPNTAMPEARKAVLKALELDETLAEAHASLAYVKLIYDWDWSGADREFRRAIDLNPAYPTGHQWYALYFNAIGRPEDALSELRKAEGLDPLSPAVKTALSEAYYFARNYDQAAVEAQKALEMDPNFVLGLVTLARAREQQGRYAEAIVAFDKASALTGGAPATLTFLAHAYALNGERGKAQTILNSLMQLPRTGSNAVYVPALYVAGIYAALGDKDNSFRYLKQAVQERCEYLIYLDREAMADVLRGDPQFNELLTTSGLRPQRLGLQ